MPDRKVIINGTDTNPFAHWGMKHNPFPSVGKAEWNAFEMALNSLDGEPIKDEQDIRERLKGCHEDFIKGIIERWEPGKRVSFELTWPD